MTPEMPIVKLLIVDDRKENLFSLKSLLADIEVEIFTAKSGAEALALMVDHDFALALLDVQMPEMDGFELAELMRGAEKTKNIPIIFVTAAAESSGFAFKGYESGAVDFMYKPINPVILKSKIRVFIELDTQKKLLQGKMKELKKAKEAAENANRLKSAFLANMSHEIRTPLNAVIGFAELLNDKSVTPDEIKEYSQIISRSGKSLVNIIDDILDLSKVEAGHLEIERVSYSPLAVAQEVIDLLMVKANRKNLTLKMNSSKDFPLKSVSDPSRLRQILMNIVGNALKFTDTGGVTVSLVYAKEDQMLSFIIEDTGLGIAANHSDKLFKPFMQADNSITRKFGGTGLGLVLAKRLAQLMGGDVLLIKSEPNKGSIFEVRIKHSDLANAKTLVTKDIPKVTTEKSIEGLHVLLVEDSEDNRYLMQMFLSKRGVKLEMANNGEEGIRMALKSNPDLILMDIQMPVLDGYQATLKLREQNFNKPIIALTAHAMVSEQEKCFAVGCNDFLSKPLNQKELLTKLSYYS